MDAAIYMKWSLIQFSLFLFQLALTQYQWQGWRGKGGGQSNQNILGKREERRREEEGSIWKKKSIYNITTVLNGIFGIISMYFYVFCRSHGPSFW